MGLSSTAGSQVTSILSTASKFMSKGTNTLESKSIALRLNASHSAAPRVWFHSTTAWTGGRGGYESRVSRPKPEDVFRKFNAAWKKKKKKRIKPKTWTHVSCNERKSLLQKIENWPKHKNTSMRISSETSWAFSDPDGVVLEKPVERFTASIDLKNGSHCYLRVKQRIQQRRVSSHTGTAWFLRRLPPG